MTTAHDADVIVIGAGNAALVAALAALERGRKVLVLERAPRDHAGGNSYYTAGATRIAHGGLEDLQGLVEFDERHDRTTVPPYSVEDYRDDLYRLTEGRTDPSMAEVLVAEAHPALRWLKDSHGFRYRLMYERQAYATQDGGFLFWGGIHVGNVDGGQGLIADAFAAVRRLGGEVRFGHAVVDFIVEAGAVTGVEVEADGARSKLRAESVILAAGGFESSAELRKKFLGDGWQNAKVRGTPFNTGDLLVRALDLGAAPAGDWGSCHSVAWDAWAESNESNRELTNRLTRQGYFLGIVVNRDGERFLDEGADFRNYTYAKYGGEILKQPGSMAFQIYDAQIRPMLRSEEYDMPGIGMVQADTIEQLAEGMGVDASRLVATVDAFNASIDRSIPADPNVKDGRSARTTPPKSNWAYPIETPPFYAYPVTCGITFTYGGLRGDLHGRVLDSSGEPIPGLLACGEALGGLFSVNYPGGSGLAAGCVFGRRAGSVA